MENSQPLVSVIIPMFNVEKYIAQCLESVLAQTFKKFEVVVVDNCSTDNSAAIVESYAPKFAQIGALLKFLRRNENSGGPSEPRNEGLEISRGKYIYFLDSDDLILKDALENLYNTAEETQAEVLIGKSFFTSAGFGENFLKEIQLSGNENDNNFELLLEDLKSRIMFYMKRSIAYIWLYFSRRDFLIENDIKFLPTGSEDTIWIFEVLCFAKKSMLVPDIWYIYRRHPGSITDIAYKTELSPDSIYKKFDRIIKGLKHVDDVMGRLEFFQQNLEERYAVIDFIVTQNITWLLIRYGEFSPALVYENLREAFTKETGQFDVLISYLVSNLIHRMKIYQADELAEIKKTLQK